MSLSENGGDNNQYAGERRVNEPDSLISQDDGRMQLLEETGSSAKEPNAAIVIVWVDAESEIGRVTKVFRKRPRAPGRIQAFK